MIDITNTLCFFELVTIDEVMPCLGAFLEKLLIIQLIRKFLVDTELKHTEL